MVNHLEYTGTARVLAREYATDVGLGAPPSVRIVPSRSRAVRVLDIVVASVLLVGLTPLLVVIALAVKLTSRGPLVYRQTRYGLGGETFELLKFRSMVPDADQRLNDLLASDPALREEFEVHAKLHVDPRISRIGRVLRPSGLDELPQLINVLKGEMSMVGPRPLPTYEGIRYGDLAQLVWSVKPGLTGPWQIGGRSDITYDERIQIDVGYVRDRTVAGDVALITRTATQLLSGRLRGGY